MKNTRKENRALETEPGGAAASPCSRPGPRAQVQVLVQVQSKSFATLLIEFFVEFVQVPPRVFGVSELHVWTNPFDVSGVHQC